MIQEPIPAVKATRERLGTDVSLNSTTSGWRLLTESHSNREEYKATGELMLDINEDTELWLTQSSEIRRVERTQTLSVASMMSDWDVQSSPVSVDDLASLQFEGLTGAPALEVALARLEDGLLPTPFDPSAGKSSERRSPGFWKRLFGS